MSPCDAITFVAANRFSQVRQDFSRSFVVRRAACLHEFIRFFDPLLRGFYHLFHAFLSIAFLAFCLSPGGGRLFGFLFRFCLGTQLFRSCEELFDRPSAFASRPTRHS